ncbi:hypothetical protein WA171_003376, partial [Blastocystis sp. BT1]
MVFLFVDHFLFMKRSHIDENKSIDPFQDFCNQFAFGRNSKRNDVTPSKIPKTDGTDQVQTESDLRKDHDLDPFVAPYPNKYRDKFCSPCSTCFNQCKVCTHNPEKQLDLLIIGHNPSEHAWKSGNMYSNPTNRMWKILTGTLSSSPKYPGVIRSTLSINDQNTLPQDYRIGFCDLGVVPGNQSDVFTKDELLEWRKDLFLRLRKHLQRVCKESHNDPTCSLVCHAPRVVLFSGKKQYTVVAKKTAGISMGLQTDLPIDWPFKQEAKVFVCPSSSGRVVMKKEAILDA